MEPRRTLRISLALVLVASSLVTWVVLARSARDGARTAALAPGGESAARQEPTSGLEAVASEAGEPGEAQSSSARDTAARSSRDSLPVAALVGRATDPSGRPLAGAVVSWAPLLAELGDPGARLADLDHERIRSVTVLTESEANGGFRFAAPPPEAERIPSALWITHPDHAAPPVLLEPQASPWRWPGVAFAPGEPYDVRVVDQAGEPVGGATVEQFLLFSAPAYDVADPLGFARRVFWREEQTDAEGRAHPPSTHGATVLRARRGGKTSSTWVGERNPEDDPIELVLSDAFWLSGLVRVPSGRPELLDGPRVAAGFHTDFADYRAIDTTLRVRADGTFGPARLPILAGTLLAVEVAGGEIVRREIADLPVPQPEEEVRVEFDVEAGEHLLVDVVDPEGVGLESAGVRAHVQVANGDWSEAALGWTNPDGRVDLAGIPAGHVCLEAWREGYSRLAFPGELHVVPLPAGQAIRIELRRATSVSGVVRSGGEPLPAFTLLYWTEQDSTRTERDFASPEGRFTLADVTLGSSLSLVAYAPSLPQTPPFVVEVPEGGVQDIVIEIPAARIGRGVVHDGRTGAPLAGAEVRLLTSVLGKAQSWRAERTTTDASGSFEIPVGPGSGGFGVSAPGYLVTVGWIPEKDDPVIDLGITVMQPACTVHVRASGLVGASYSDCVLFNWNTPELGDTPLGQDGRVSLQGVRPGGNRFTLSLPDETDIDREVHLSPGEEAWLELDLSGSTELSVVLRAPEGVDSAEPARVRVFQETEHGTRVRAQRLARDGATRVLGLVPGTATIEIQDGVGHSLATREFMLVAGSNAATLALAGRERRLRLVDGAGEPLASARVIVAMPGGSTGWRIERSTDAEGVFAFGPLAADEVALFVYSDTHGIAWDRRVSLPPDPELVPEVVIDLETRIELTLVEEGEPAAGAAVLLRAEGLPLPESYYYTADREGRVFGPKSAEGSYMVRIQHARYWPMQIPIAVSSRTRSHTLELFSKGSLVLRVTDAEGMPVPAARCSLSHRELGDVAPWVEASKVTSSDRGLATGGDGMLRLAGLPRGEYAWSVAGPTSSLAGTLRVPPVGEGVATVRLP